jgi:hypothetical protein
MITKSMKETPGMVNRKFGKWLSNGVLSRDGDQEGHIGEGSLFVILFCFWVWVMGQGICHHPSFHCSYFHLWVRFMILKNAIKIRLGVEVCLVQ